MGDSLAGARGKLKLRTGSGAARIKAMDSNPYQAPKIPTEQRKDSPANRLRNRIRLYALIAALVCLLVYVTIEAVRVGPSNPAGLRVPLEFTLIPLLGFAIGLLLAFIASFLRWIS